MLDVLYNDGVGNHGHVNVAVVEISNKFATNDDTFSRNDTNQQTLTKIDLNAV